YERVHKDFPNFSKAGESLFMLAFTYDEDLDDIDKARATYERFIAEYPNHGFADDAQMLIGNLGKTDEEVLRELESRNQ
ncbi:MAG: tetratricopeptide repeat protein, partial [Bacteroidota bacterium]